MVVDTSILVAILKREPGHERHLDTLIAAPVKFMSAVSIHELAIVWFGYTRDAASIPKLFDWITTKLRIEVIPFDFEAARNATVAYTKFGKGIHRPGLNMGDCAVHALATQYDLPVFSTSTEFKDAKLKTVRMTASKQ